MMQINKVKVLFHTVTTLLVFSFLLTPIIPVLAQVDSGDTAPPSDISAPTSDTPAPNADPAPSADFNLPLSTTLEVPSQVVPAPVAKSPEEWLSDLKAGKVDIDNLPHAPEYSSAIPETKQNETLADSIQVSPMATTIVAAGSELDPMGQYYAKANKNASGLKTDELTGAMSYSVPIVTPPGRNGFDLGLELSYNSQSTKVDGPFGSWNLNLPTIERINRFGTDKLFTSNLFTSSLSGELSATGNPSQFITKDEKGSFLKYNFDAGSNSWKVTDKQGTVYSLGTTAASRQDNPANSAQVFKWLVDEIKDTNGNIVKYDYFKDNGEIYIDTVSYTNQSDGTFFHKVKFIRDNAAKKNKSGATGFLAQTNYHITEIQVYAGPRLTSKYTITYSNDSIDNILTIYRYFYAEDGGWTRQDIGFSYQATENEQKAWQYNPVNRQAPDGAVFHHYPGTPGRRLADVNGDGRVDIIVSEQQQSPGNPRYIISDSHVYLSKGNDWVEDFSWQWPEEFRNDLGQSVKTTFSDINGVQTGLMLLDVNGDGLPDLVRAVIVQDGGSFTRRNKVYLNNGSGWAEDASWQFPTDPTTFENSNISPGPLVFQKAEQLSGTHTERYNFETDIQSSERQYVFKSLTELTNLFIADVNGDGLPDVVKRDSVCSGCGKQNLVFLNTGHGWAQSSGWQFPGLELSSKTMRLMDINNDGLADFVHWPAGNWNGFSAYLSENPAAYLNTGMGWTLDSAWTFPLGGRGDSNPTSMFYRNPQLLGFGDKPTLVNMSVGPGVITNEPDSGMRMMDVNGDGLPDIVWCIAYKEFQDATATNISYGKQCEVFPNFGRGWYWDTFWKLPTDFDLSFSQIPQAPFSPQPVYVNTTFKYNDGNSQFGYSNFFNSLEFQDFNDDGTADFVHSRNQTSGVGVQVFENKSPKQGLLSQVRLPLGGKINITYAPSATLRDGGQNQLNPKLRSNLFVVSKIEIDDNNGNISKTSYSYEGGEYYYNSPTDKKFSGFKAVTKTNNDGSYSKTYFHQGNSSDTSYGEFEDHVSKIGQPYRSEVYDASGNLFSKTVNKWDRADLGNGANFVKLVQTVNYSYDGTGNHKDKAENYIWNDTNGNQTRKMEWGEVAGNDNGTFADMAADKFFTDFSYAEGLNGSVPVSALSKETTVDSSGVKVKENNYYYDNLVLGEINKGNQTKAEDWKAGSSYSSYAKTYNNYGLLTQLTDARSKNTWYYYDTYNLFPIKVTNAVNQDTNYTYDYANGQVKQTKDPNGFIFETVYDGLGRVVQEMHPHELFPEYTISKNSYNYSDGSFPKFIKKTAHMVYGGADVETYIYVDGLGRKTQERQQAEQGYSVKDYIYNNMGQLQKETLPYLSEGAGKTPPANLSFLYINYTYDALGRVKNTANAIGTTSNTYTPWKVTITDPRGKTKDLYKNAYGNLVQVDEHNASNTFSTYYTYNYLNNLTKITDALGNIRNFTYDGLGRRLTAQDLHNINDITFGVWTYSYDDNGNLISQTDPKSQVVNFNYDDLNRLLSEDYAGKTGVEVTYRYDTCQNGKGRLCSITTADIIEAKMYNPLGNLIKETKTIGGAVYATSYAYDMQGNLLSITNPDNSQIKYTYNRGGQIETVQKKETSDPNFVDIVTDFDYEATGQISFIGYGNGIKTDNSYDSSLLYRLVSKRTIAPDAGGIKRIQQINYIYDANGNITSLIDTSETKSAKTVDYTYDDLNRLTSATTSSVAPGQQPYTENYSYDAIGNILTKGGENYTYAGTEYANPHAVTAIGSTTFSYDKNGNLTSENNKTYSWDYNNRLLSTVVPGSTATTITSTYDTTGQRISYNVSYGATNITTTYYPSKFYNINNAGKSIKHIFAGGLMLATIVSQGKVLSLAPTSSPRARPTPMTAGGSSTGGTNLFCTPPNTGNWTITSSCTFTGTAIAPASVIVSPGKVLTLAPNSKLLVNLQQYNLSGDIVINKTATFRQVKPSDAIANTSPIITYISTDHLSGSSVITDSLGVLIETTDYFPYGSIRLDEKTTDYSEQRKYIGEEYDADTGLNYLNARYYNANIGRFISQDPVFITASFDLTDPQGFNSYAYARNNPMANVDITGLFWKKAAMFGLGVVTSVAVGVAITAATVAAAPALVTTLAVVATAAAVVTVAQIGVSTYNSYQKGGVSGVVSDTKNYIQENPFSSGLFAGGILCIAVCGPATKAIKGLSFPKELPAYAGANKFNHIFGKSDHGLGGLVKSYGSEEKAFIALQQATEKAIAKKGITGIFDDLKITVGSYNVTVRGNVSDNNTVKIGTAFIKK